MNVDFERVAAICRQLAKRFSESEIQAILAEYRQQAPPVDEHERAR